MTIVRFTARIKFPFSYRAHTNSCLLAKLDVHLTGWNDRDLNMSISQYLTNLMHKICFTISLFHASTCFKHHVLIIRRSKLHYTASGIITQVWWYLKLIVKQILCIKLVKYWDIYWDARSTKCQNLNMSIHLHLSLRLLRSGVVLPPHHTSLCRARGQTNLAEGRDTSKHWTPHGLTINVQVVLLRSSICGILCHVHWYLIAEISGKPLCSHIQGSKASSLTPQNVTDWSSRNFDNYQPTLRNISEDQSSYLNRGGILKSRLDLLLVPVLMLLHNLTLNLLTWRKWWASNNASRWQMGFDSAFKWIRTVILIILRIFPYV